jgi:hypothetical protein
VSSDAEGVRLVRCKAGGETVGLVIGLGWPQARPLGRHWVWESKQLGFGLPVQEVVGETTD